MYALNLTQSPEKDEYWERADPFELGAGETGEAIETSFNPAPRGPRQHRAKRRRRSNQASIGSPKVLGEASQIERIVAEYGGPT